MSFDPPYLYPSILPSFILQSSLPNPSILPIPLPFNPPFLYPSIFPSLSFNPPFLYPSILPSLSFNPSFLILQSSLPLSFNPLFLCPLILPFFNPSILPCFILQSSLPLSLNPSNSLQFPFPSILLLSFNLHFKFMGHYEQDWSRFFL